MTQTPKRTSAETLEKDGIFAIDTHYIRPGLDASHLLVCDDEAAFVDCGVSDSVPLLLAALADHAIDPAQLRYLFLTHIHLDHAGGAGQLMQQLPNATLVVHPRGAHHMADPSKLIAGATAVYGEHRFRELYGEILPVPAERQHVARDGETLLLGTAPLALFFTEGHARHHFCLHHPRAAAVFTGDSFGLSYPVFDSDQGPLIFPTTTPVHFDPDAAHDSIDRIVALDARRALLTHYSAVEGLPALAAQLHADLDAFVSIALASRAAPDREPAIASALHAYLRGRLRQHGTTLPEAECDAWLSMDIELNAQGLNHWLSTID